VFYSNFVPKTKLLRYSTCNYTLTLKPALGVESLNVIGTDTYRSTTYDFLLTFYSNYGPGLSRTVSEINGDFSRKLQIFPPRVFCAPAEWVAIGIGYRRSEFKKTRIMGLPVRERSLMIASAVWIQSTNLTDGQTNTGRQQSAKDCV